jgi:hypothetical protein
MPHPASCCSGGGGDHDKLLHLSTLPDRRLQIRSAMNLRRRLDAEAERKCAGHERMRKRNESMMTRGLGEIGMQRRHRRSWQWTTVIKAQKEREGSMAVDAATTGGEEDEEYRDDDADDNATRTTAANTTTTTIDDRRTVCGRPATDRGGIPLPTTTTS